MPDTNAYLLISPCRNEAEYMRRTIDSVIAQSIRPSLWVIVNDGSTDATPEILSEYCSHHDWIKVVEKPDRGHRSVGPGVVEAFYVGIETVDLTQFGYLCKLDLDLELPRKYFEELIRRMNANKRIGTCSGKAYFLHRSGEKVSEKIGNEMSLGMTKFYDVICFKQIGGFVREVMWDGLDCHKARQLGWIACSWDDEELNFEHLRPMGSSQNGILTGRRRHGFGQYYMGSDPVYFFVTAILKMFHPPRFWGGLAMIQGYLGAVIKNETQHQDIELRKFIRAYQRRALLVGKAKAISEIEARQPWKPDKCDAC